MKTILINSNSIFIFFVCCFSDQSFRVSRYNEDGCSHRESWFFFRWGMSGRKNIKIERKPQISALFYIPHQHHQTVHQGEIRSLSKEWENTRIKYFTMFMTFHGFVGFRLDFSELMLPFFCVFLLLFLSLSSSMSSWYIRGIAYIKFMIFLVPYFITFYIICNKIICPEEASALGNSWSMTREFWFFKSRSKFSTKISTLMSELKWAFQALTTYSSRLVESLTTLFTL